MKEPKKDFFIMSKVSKDHRSGPIKGKTRTALFWSNLESHPHWKQNISEFLPIPKEQLAKIDLINIIRTNDSAIKLQGKPYNPNNQTTIKNRMNPNLFGKFLDNRSYTHSETSETNYIIDFSNMRITIIFDKSDIDLKNRLDLLCDTLKHAATGKKKHAKTRKTRRKRK